MKGLKIEIWNENNKVFMQVLDQGGSVREKEYIYKANERWVEIYQRPNRRIKSKIKNLEGYKINDKRGVLIFSTTRAAEEYVQKVKDTVEEYNASIRETTEILTKEEKEFIKQFAKSFKEEVEWVVKYSYFFGTTNEEYISIKLSKKNFIFPTFEKGTMYKGMETDRRYTLEELKLWED